MKTKFIWLSGIDELRERVYKMRLEDIYLILRNAGCAPIEIFDDAARNWVIELVMDGSISETEIIEELG